MLITKNIYLEYKNKIKNNNFKLIILKKNFTKKTIKKSIKKILLYYITYIYSKNNNLEIYKNLNYIIQFDDEIEQNRNEFFINYQFLKYFNDNEEIELKF